MSSTSPKSRTLRIPPALVFVLVVLTIVASCAVVFLFTQDNALLVPHQPGQVTPTAATP